MSITRRICTGALLIAGLAVGAWWFSRRSSAITGRVFLHGTPPPEVHIALDAATAQLRRDGLTTRHYLVSSNGGLANVFVSISAGLGQRTVPSTSAPVVIGFRGGRIEPFVVSVFTNQIVRFQNQDPILHNLHATPRVNGNREFNLAMPTATPALVEPWYRALFRRLVLRRPKPSKGIDRIFPVPELFIRLKCDVHPWEFGYMCVTDHPFVAVTDEKGNFAFPPGLPSGRYQIEARHLKAGVATQEIVVTAGEEKRVEFRLEVPPDSGRPVVPSRGDGVLPTNF